MILFDDNEVHTVRIDGKHCSVWSAAVTGSLRDSFVTCVANDDSDLIGTQYLVYNPVASHARVCVCVSIHVSVISRSVCHPDVSRVSAVVWHSVPLCI